MAEPRCPKCDGPVEYDEVDIGVGVQRGPEWCINPECGWNAEQELEEFIGEDLRPDPDLFRWWYKDDSPPQGESP